MQTGIVGLPQVGKTTLFKILTRAHLDGAAARARTHVGVAQVPDERLDRLAKLYKPRKVTHATVEYVDVGGLVEGRAKDSALLTELRQVDALAHVVRLFENPAVATASGKLDRLRDIQNLELEFMLADLDQIMRRIERIEKDLQKKSDPLLTRELGILRRCQVSIGSEKPLRELEFSADEQKILAGFMFFSHKPVLYVLNLGDEDAGHIDRAAENYALGTLKERPNTIVVPVCGRIEAELAEMEEGAAAEMRMAYGLKEPGLDRMIRATYRLLGLRSFFTVGDPEVRAWTIRQGTTALKAAGIIHSDFERGFIKAEVVGWGDLLDAGSFAAARERAKVRLEGRQYVVGEGEVIVFRHSR